MRPIMDIIRSADSGEHLTRSERKRLDDCWKASLILHAHEICTLMESFIGIHTSHDEEEED